MNGLSETTSQIIQKMFPAEHHEVVAQLLLKNLDDLARIQLAVLKRSNGNLDRLQRAIECAQTDWRDTLVDAGFAECVWQHNNWAKEYLS